MHGDGYYFVQTGPLDTWPCMGLGFRLNPEPIWLRQSNEALDVPGHCLTMANLTMVEICNGYIQIERSALARRSLMVPEHPTTVLFLVPSMMRFMMREAFVWPETGDRAG